MTYINYPNLPQDKIALAAVSSTATEAIAALAREGIDVIEIEPVSGLPAPVASHADLQLLHLGGNKLLLAQELQQYNERFKALGFFTSYLDTKLGNKYPHDISLNFSIYNNRCFGLSSIMPLQLYNHCNHTGLQIINSNQGYARCSVAIVGTAAAMTADPTLYKLLTNQGVDVLKLEYGDIVLDGYNTGFIGGCCGLISNDRLAICGNLERYNQGKAVLAFLAKHNVTPVYLQDCKLLDIGGIVPLAERK